MARAWSILGAVLLLLCAHPMGYAQTDWQPPVRRAFIEDQFARFDPDYPRHKAARLERLQTMEDKLFALQVAGEPMFCSAHMLNEIRWLLHSTADWSRIDRQLWLLGVSLTDKDQYFAMNQESHDGSWGVCYEEWFKKLDPMIQALNRMAGNNVPPEHTMLEFLQPIATPDQLVAYLDRVRVSDIAQNGLNRRDELGAVMAVVAEIVHKSHVFDYIVRNVQGIELDAAYKAHFQRWVDEWQDPETGYWGAWYRVGDKLLRSADLSFTYHIVAYRRGEVAHWERIVDTTLAMQGDEYPFGWRVRGDLTNHNAYDVVRILEQGWTRVDEARQEQMRTAIGELLDWSLANTLRTDGSFRAEPGFSSSVSDAQYYGVSLLVKAGYCSAQPPFWTGRVWPEAQERCCRIAGYLTTLNQSVPAVQAARDRLAQAYPLCNATPADEGAAGPP